jgi:hypothetical protein
VKSPVTLDFRRIGVLQTFQVGSWSVVYLLADESEPVCVFYAHDPLTTGYITLWSGAAKSDQAQTIREWTLKNAPGIPRRLASCFVCYVTTKPDQHKSPARGK